MRVCERHFSCTIRFPRIPSEPPFKRRYRATLESKGDNMRLIPREVRLKNTFSNAIIPATKLKEIKLQCLVKINTAKLTTTLNQGVKVRISILSVSSLQFNYFLGELEMELHR